jgi:hypothetical protein
VDSLQVRSARRRRIAGMLHTLEERGGDELAVIEAEVDGFIRGLDSHGPLNLDEPRDWQREMDQEKRDYALYEAMAREADRRAIVNAIAAWPDDVDGVDGGPPGVDGAALVGDLDRLRGGNGA